MCICDQWCSKWISFNPNRVLFRAKFAVLSLKSGQNWNVTWRSMLTINRTGWYIYRNYAQKPYYARNLNYNRFDCYCWVCCVTSRCTECSVSFNYEENLILHMATHDPNNTVCPECGKKFSRMASLKVCVTFVRMARSCTKSYCFAESLIYSRSIPVICF